MKKTWLWSYVINCHLNSKVTFDYIQPKSCVYQIIFTEGSYNRDKQQDTSEEYSSGWISSYQENFRAPDLLINLTVCLPSITTRFFDVDIHQTYILWVCSFNFQFIFTNINKNTFLWFQSHHGFIGGCCDVKGKSKRDGDRFECFHNR